MASKPSASSAGSSKSAGSGYDSPQAVFEAEKKAQLDENWGAHFDTYSPDSRDRLVGTIAYGALMVAPTTGKGDEVKSVLQKHGIDESKMPTKPSMTDMADLQGMLKKFEKQQTELLALIKDKRAFYIDVASLLGGKSDAAMTDKMKERVDASRKAQAAANLIDVEIAGDAAVGNREMTINGMQVKVPVFFTQIDGSWYLRQPTTEESQEMGRKMGEQIGRAMAEKMKAEKANAGKE